MRVHQSQFASICLVERDLGLFDPCPSLILNLEVENACKEKARGFKHFHYRTPVSQHVLSIKFSRI